MNFICLDGKFLPSDKAVLLADNKGFRYGDSLFETMKMVNGKIHLASLHFHRLFAGLQLLDYKLPTHFSDASLLKDIQELTQKNKCAALARIRLTIFRGHGGLYDGTNSAGYLIECWSLNESAQAMNENGLIIDILPDATKSCDKYSNLKSANFLIYTLAARYAKSNHLNECLVLNTKGNIADGSVTNLFLVKGNEVYTPSLDQGCVAGVMRKYLIDRLRENGYNCNERAISPEDLLNTDEVFLTNSVQGIKWVKEFRGKKYTNNQSKKFYNQFIQPISA